MRTEVLMEAMTRSPVASPGDAPHRTFSLLILPSGGESTMTEDELVAEYLKGRDFSCPGCGYNLRGLSGQTCPECGLAFRLQLVPIGISPDDPEAERIRLADYLRDRDVPCPSCGFNLRDHRDMTCPRCGLRLSAWLLKPRGLERERQTVGVRLLLAVVVVFAAIVLIFILLPFILQPLRWP